MSRTVWNHPEALIELLAELSEPDAVAINPESRLVFVNEELGTLTLNGAEVNKVLSSIRAVDQLFEALDQTSDCTVELANFEIQPEVADRLEELFDYFESV